jgi:hypothetical protein
MVSGFPHWFVSQRGNAQGTREDTPRILAIVPHGPDRLLLQAISQHIGWALAFAGTPPGILSGCPGIIPPIVIYDRRLPPYNLREIFGILTRGLSRPYVILLSPTIDRDDWDELQRAGSCDILHSPVNRVDLIWAVRRAWQFWRIHETTPFRTA